MIRTRYQPTHADILQTICFIVVASARGHASFNLDWFSRPSPFVLPDVFVSSIKVHRKDFPLVRLICLDAFICTPHNRLIKHTWRGTMPRTTIEIDDRLLSEAKKASGQSTTKGVVHEGLKLLVRQSKLRKYASLRGSGLTELTHEELELIRRDE